MEHVKILNLITDVCVAFLTAPITTVNAKADAIFRTRKHFDNSNWMISSPLNDAKSILLFYNVVRNRDVALTD